MIRLIVVIGSLVTATAAAADWTPVPGRVLKEMVAGSTVVIDAPMGFKLPITHADDGTLAGEAGGLAFYLGSATDNGRWWVAGDRLCYKWARWFKSEPRCMKIRRDGTRIAWEKDDGDSGTATLTLRKTPPPEQIAAASKPAEQAATEQRPAKTPPPAAAAAPAAAAKPVHAAQAAAAASVATTKPVAAAPRQLAAAPAPSVNKTPVPKRQATVPASQIAAAPRQPAPLPAAPQPQPPLQPQSPPPSPPYGIGGPAQLTYRVVSVAADDVLNVRQGPSTEHPAIGALSPEARGVRMIGPCEAEWCRVRHQGVTGWVNRYYLQPTP